MNVYAAAVGQFFYAMMPENVAFEKKVWIDFSNFNSTQISGVRVITRSIRQQTTPRLVLQSIVALLPRTFGLACSVRYFHFSNFNNYVSDTCSVLHPISTVSTWHSHCVTACFPTRRNKVDFCFVTLLHCYDVMMSNYPNIISFSDPGVDMAAMIVQMGRDHGLPAYVEWREQCGFPRTDGVGGFEQSCFW